MILGTRFSLTLELTAAAAALLMASDPARAQPAPSPGTSLERAQKAADAVFHWIKLNADKGANRQPPAPAPAPAARKPAPVAAAPRPVPAAAPSPQPAAAPAPAPVMAAAPAPQPAALPEPEAAPVMLASAAPAPAPAAPLPLAAELAQAPAPQPEAAETPLKLLVRVNPSIPRQLQQQSFRNGYARVKFVVAPDGQVSQVQSLQASHSRLGTAAVDAVRQWRFEPIATAREAAVEFAFNNVEE